MPQLGSRKSRKGCQRCKQRRVKCDEQVPCGTCVRRNEHCSFLDPIRSGSSETTADEGIPPDSEDWLPDLELMHHYTTVLSSLGAREKVVHLWRDYIPQQALKHAFLMHGLLAFAALHLAYLRPDSSLKYLALCDKHQSIALKKFRSILSSPRDPEYADALFALSATLSLSSMARSCALSESATMDMDAVAELFVLTKGVANVINLSRERIVQGPLAEMLENAVYPSDTKVHLPVRVSFRFEAIRHLVGTYGLDQEALEDCQKALTELEEVYKSIAYFSPMTDIEIAVASKWQVTVSMGYIRLVQAHNPVALIILAYYAAAITAIRTAWYTKNWAEYALRGISLALDEGMQQWLQWPMQQIQEGMSELGVRSPNEDSKFTANLTLNVQPLT